MVVGTVFDYAMFVMPVVYEEGTTDQISQDTLFSSHSYMSLGVSRNLELHVKLPLMLLAQSFEHPSEKGTIIGNGMSYLGGGAKYRLFKQHIYEMAAGGELGFDLMKSNPYVGDGVVPFGISTYLAVSADYDPVILGINLGYRFRTIGTPIYHQDDLPAPIPPVAHTILFSSALSVKTGIFGYVIGEVYGSHAVVEQYDVHNQSDRSQTSLEYLLGGTYFFNNGIGIKLGGGSQLFHGIGTSKLRLIAGFDYAFDAKKLGIIPAFKRPSKQKKSQAKQQPLKLPPDPFDDNNYDDLESSSAEDYPGAQGSDDWFNEE